MAGLVVGIGPFMGGRVRLTIRMRGRRADRRCLEETETLDEQPWSALPLTSPVVRPCKSISHIMNFWRVSADAIWPQLYSTEAGELLTSSSTIQSFLCSSRT